MASGWNGPLEIARWEVEQRSAFVGAIFYLNILAWVMRMFWFSKFLNELKSTAGSWCLHFFVRNTLPKCQLMVLTE